ncbi:MAG: hypothetical protein ACYC4L_16485 [Chloroflexota bacterium]
MSDAARSVIAFALPLAVGRLLEYALGTSWGRDLVVRRGSPELASPEGRQVVRKYSGAAAAAAAALAFTAGRFGGAKETRRPDGEATLNNVAELVLAAGALLRVWADYAKDRKQAVSRIG